MESEDEAQVHTAAAATLMQYMIETEVAAQSLALLSGPAAQVTGHLVLSV
jgi:hypothetical protein